MHLRSMLLGSALFLGLAAQAAPAAAQPRGYQGQTVTCSSNDNRRSQCATSFSGRAQLVENLSGTRCVEGSNWGSGRGFVWVDRGCRARFADARGAWDNGSSQGGTIRCESTDKRQRECRTGWRDAVLVRQLSGSRCEEGRSWGTRNGSIWVSDGCRGEFAEGRRGSGWSGDRGPGRENGASAGYEVSCNSDNQRRRNCDWNGRQGRPYLIQQQSGTRCEEGRTWGYDRGQLWVDGGCRARFGAR